MVMTGQQDSGNATGLAQVRAEYPGWASWAGLSGTCYAIHLATLRTDPPPPIGEVYVLRASDPAGLLGQLRATQLPHCPPTEGPGGHPPVPDHQGDQPGEVARLRPAAPGPKAVTGILRAISELTAHAAWLQEFSEPGDQPGTRAVPVTTDELTALSELAALGAELNQRGYLTHLRMTHPVFLTIGHRQARQPQRIYADGEFLCWGDERHPFCARWAVPAAMAAEEAEVLTLLAIIGESPAATHPQEPR
jgi:hypothetical protein